MSLCIVSQRPAELDPTILSQCNTIFSMRLTNERDQQILRAGISDAAASLLEFMPTMGTGEAITFGEGVALPTRIKFDMLPADSWPKSNTASFTKNWAREMPDDGFLNDIVIRWRAQSHNPDALGYEPPGTPSAAAPAPAPAQGAAYAHPAPGAAAAPGHPTLRRSPLLNGNGTGTAAPPQQQGFGQQGHRAAPPNPPPAQPQPGAPAQQQSLASLIRQFRS